MQRGKQGFHEPAGNEKVWQAHFTIRIGIMIRSSYFRLRILEPKIVVDRE